MMELIQECRFVHLYIGSGRTLYTTHSLTIFESGHEVLKLDVMKDILEPWFERFKKERYNMENQHWKKNFAIVARNYEEER